MRWLDRGPASFRTRLLVAALSGLIYILAFIPIRAATGYEPMALNVVPILTGALLFGMRGGAAAWLLIIPLNITMHLALGLKLGIGALENQVRLVVGLGVGVTVGRLRDLSLALEREAEKSAAASAEREKAEKLLRQSERERVEAKLKEQLVAADRHRALGTLAAGAAHEINNPLSYVVSGLAFMGDELRELLGDDTPEVPPWVRERLKEMQDAIGEAVDGSERVRLIVRDLNTFSSSDGGQTELVDVRAQLDTALGLAKQEISARAKLVREFGQVPSVPANPARLGQVFLNLLLNAALAIPEGRPGQNEVRVVTRAEGNGVVVEVHDTGSGLDPEACKHLFDPFFTTREGGTGLGLYVCHNLMVAMGGTIAVESEVGRGSIFRVSLPASPAVAPTLASQL